MLNWLFCSLNLDYFSTSSLWGIWSIAPASLLNPSTCRRVRPATRSLCPPEQLHRRHYIRLVGGFQSHRVLDLWSFYEALITPCVVFCFLKRGLTESSFLKRSEAGGAVPSITISIPKPSFAPSVASAAADKTSALNHLTGHYHCSNVATSLEIWSHVNINLKWSFSPWLLLFSSQVQARQNSPLAKPSSSDRSTG